MLLITTVTNISPRENDLSIQQKVGKQLQNVGLQTRQLVGYNISKI